MTKPQHIMLDLETLGTRPGSIVLTIGAVKFDKGGIRDKFYVAIDKNDSDFFDLTSDPSTVDWWQKQSAEAREAAFSGKTPLHDALVLFAKFCGTERTTTVWGNGSDFDNVLLEEAYQAVSMDPPWRFYQSRCYRTVKNLFPNVKTPSVGTEHHALDDAIYQANRLIAIARRHCFEIA